ncbi:hypothetical protein MHU86_25480 [Fragilaria crotonensis]|nr:hypothetical protein MHU86_25480 [Fragilaria crotonensis]
MRALSAPVQKQEPSVVASTAIYSLPSPYLRFTYMHFLQVSAFDNTFRLTLYHSEGGPHNLPRLKLMHRHLRDRGKPSSPRIAQNMGDEESGRKALRVGSRVEYLKAQYQPRSNLHNPFSRHIDHQGFVAWLAKACADEDDAALWIETVAEQSSWDFSGTSQHSWESSKQDSGNP